MKAIYTILSILCLSSCYTKSKCVQKFCKQDTVSVTVRDTIVVDRITTDTVFSARIDSVFIQQDKLQIVYKRVRDSVYISGKVLSDTVYYEKVIRVPIKCPDYKPTFWQRVKSGLNVIVSALVLGIVLGLIVAYRLRR